MAMGLSPKLRVIGIILAFYQSATPAASVLALLVFCGLLARALLGKGSVLCLIGAALLLAILAMMAILALIQITSFPAITPAYLSEVYPLMLFFDAIMLIVPFRWYLASGSLRPRTQLNRQPAAGSQVKQ